MSSAQHNFARQMRTLCKGISLTDAHIELVFGKLRDYPDLQITVSIQDTLAKLTYNQETILLAHKDSQTDIWRVV